MALAAGPDPRTSTSHDSSVSVVAVLDDDVEANRAVVVRRVLGVRWLSIAGADWDEDTVADKVLDTEKVCSIL